MQFLFDANMPRSALQVLIQANYSASHVRDQGLGDAPDAHINQFALQHGWTLVTRDLDFCDIRNYPPETSPGRIVVRLSETSTAADIVQLLRRFVAAPELIQHIPGHLVIIDANQVRFRPALQTTDPLSEQP